MPKDFKFDDNFTDWDDNFTESELNTTLKFEDDELKPLVWGRQPRFSAKLEDLEKDLEIK